MSMEIMPSSKEAPEAPLMAPGVDVEVQAGIDLGEMLHDKEEYLKRRRRHFELLMQQEMLKVPKEQLQRAEKRAEHYKEKFDDLGTRIQDAIKTVQGHRQVNQQLMQLTDEYMNFKKKANDRYVAMAQVI